MLVDVLPFSTVRARAEVLSTKQPTEEKPEGRAAAVLDVEVLEEVLETVDVENVVVEATDDELEEEEDVELAVLLEAEEVLVLVEATLDELLVVKLTVLVELLKVEEVLVVEEATLDDEVLVDELAVLVDELTVLVDEEIVLVDEETVLVDELAVLVDELTVLVDSVEVDVESVLELAVLELTDDEVEVVLTALTATEAVELAVEELALNETVTSLAPLTWALAMAVPTELFM